MPPVIPENMTYGDSVVMNLDLLRALEQCNIDKAEIRKIEESRK
ncbi:Rz1 lytic protein [Serratia fonticola]|nr:Rz1 lytic protein [Serratia fonticola]